MKAMILAAGLGQRMRPLTDHLPKPLLEVGGKPLIEYHLDALSTLKVTDVVINLAYLGDKISSHIGDGRRWGFNIHYSRETEPLETGGGILQALSYLGSEPFLLVNGDVWCSNKSDDIESPPPLESNNPLSRLRAYGLKTGELAHLILVPNPDFHPKGDFSPDKTGLLVNDDKLDKYTFAGLSLIDPRLITDYPEKRLKFPLVEAFRYGINHAQITAELYTGHWSDVGTPERLFELDSFLQRA